MGRRRRAGAVAALAALVLLASACGSGGSSAGSPSRAPSPGPAWDAVLARIRPDGSVPTEAALQAFSLAFGPLPGVRVPPGDAGVMPDGTLALRWLVGHWRDISPEQRAAAAALVPELGRLQPPPPASGGPGLGMLAASGLGGELAAALDAVYAAQKRSDLFYTGFAEQIAGEISSRVGVTLGIPIEAHVGRTAHAKALADAGVYTSTGGFSGTPGKCVITVSGKADALVGDDLGLVMAHEVWHCFEGAIGGLDRYWFRPKGAADWIYEGQAQWVGASLYPAAPLSALFWPDYLNSPEVPLFARSYTAIGFYAQLASSGVDVWHDALVPMLEAKDDESAFRAAGADQDRFLYVWASGYLRDPSRGQAWDIVGPGVTADRASPAQGQVGNGGSVEVSAAPYTDAIETLEVSADVLQASFSGHARISDGVGNDYLIQGAGAFCHKDGGCECPEGAGSGAPPPPPLPGPGIALAVTGGPNGASGTVQGISLEDFCNRVDLTGTWAGTWANDNGLALGGFTLTLAQAGRKVTGSILVDGKTCIRQGTIGGTVTGSTVHLVIHSVRDVTIEGSVEGARMSGTFSALACGPPYGPPNASIIVTGVWEATRTE